MHYRWNITASKPDIPLQNAEDVMSERAEKTASITVAYDFLASIWILKFGGI